MRPSKEIPSPVRIHHSHIRLTRSEVPFLANANAKGLSVKYRHIQNMGALIYILWVNNNDSNMCTGKENLIPFYVLELH